MSKLSDKGFGLVEVLVVAGLLGGLALLMTQMSDNMNKTVKNTELNSDVNSTVQTILRVLTIQANCTETFKGKNPKNAPLVVQAIKDRSGGVFVNNFKTKSLDPSISYGQGQLKIVDYSLSDSGPDVGIDTYRTTHLLINFDKGKNGLMRDASKKIPLKVELDASGNIQTCVAYANYKDSIWEVAANNLDIFYQTGNVGIGTDTPLTPFHLNYSGGACGLNCGGFFQIGGQTGDIEFNGGGDNNFVFMHKGAANGLLIFASTTSGALLTIENNGRVGISNTSPRSALEVAGGIRAKKGMPVNLDVSQVGYSFENDGDTGMFTEGGNDTQLSSLRLATDSLVGLTVKNAKMYGEFDCFSVEGPPGLGGSHVDCPAGSTLQTGGGYCVDGTIGYLHSSVPSGNGWTADCYTRTGVDIEAIAVARCCRIAP